VFVDLADGGEIRGRVLDAGCGTGEHALMLASRGFDTLGIDASPTAIELAQRKAVERGLAPRFLVWDALRLGELGQQFDTVLDCGLFHVFDDEHRVAYVESLRSALGDGGRLLLCCFSDAQPGDWGPRRVTETELRVSFGDGWRIDVIEPIEFVTNIDPPIALAWLMKATRTETA
jgi:SAM-dependent methyltransferase